MNVYVKNKNGKPLMPCKPAKARKLLSQGKAKVVNRCPFTIQLLWDCEENVQEVTVGIDKGSSITGISCVANGRILMSGEIHHRTDIKDKMDARRANRQNRRARKWYRPARFFNRASSKRSGRLPPSIKANVEEVLRVVRKIPLPISHIVIEDVQVDIARLNNPSLRGKEYQQSSRLDENLRIATLMRDGYQCTQCEKKNTNFDAHHIVYREHGGKDTIENLITLCKSCHDKVHRGKLDLDVEGVSGFLDRIAQRTMQGKTYLLKLLGQIATVSKVFGYQTSTFRKSLSLPKTHDIDALCVATVLTGEVIPTIASGLLRSSNACLWFKPQGMSSAVCFANRQPLSSLQRNENFYIIKFRPKQTRRQFHDLPRKAVGRVRYQVNAELKGFRKGDIVKVKGKWVKQINSIYSNGYLAFGRVSGEPNVAKPKDLKLLKRRQTVIWEKAV
jgi:5-methylcytosine-specific restriction endonuclease McrA